VVALPDGSPSFVPVLLTDLLGVPEAAPGPSLVLSPLGLRRLRSLVDASLQAAGPRPDRPPKLWKLVRHRHGADPYLHRAEVCSAHTSESAAGRAREKARARFVRAAGHAEATGWAWSVVADPAGMVGGPGAQP